MEAMRCGLSSFDDGLHGFVSPEVGRYGIDKDEEATDFFNDVDSLENDVVKLLRYLLLKIVMKVRRRRQTSR